MCPEIKQYVKGILNAGLLKWATNAEFKSKVKDGVLCFASKIETEKQTGKICTYNCEATFYTKNACGDTGWAHRL